MDKDEGDDNNRPQDSLRSPLNLKNNLNQDKVMRCSVAASAHAIIDDAAEDIESSSDDANYDETIDED
jgi:hypothetical protein